jgi:hypothetical protein
MKNLAEAMGIWQTMPANGHENPWAIRNPMDEARDLYRMVRSGASAVEEIRELIAVPDLIKEALLAYAERYPKDGQHIYCVLHFRERVAEEFERLLLTNENCLEPAPEEVEALTESESFLN